MSRHVLRIAQGSSVVYVWGGILWRLVGIELAVEENLKENDAKKVAKKEKKLISSAEAGGRKPVSLRKETST